MNGLKIKGGEMKPTQEQVIAWARDSGMELYGLGKDRAKFVYYLEAFAALAYEAGQESMKWDGIHSCHPDCQRPACVHTRKTYQEGYEAGRKDEIQYLSKLVAEKNETIAELVEALGTVIRGVPNTWDGVQKAKVVLDKAKESNHG